MSSPARRKTGTDRSRVSYASESIRIFESLKAGHNVLVVCSTRGTNEYPEMILPKKDGKLAHGYKNLMNRNRPLSNLDILKVYPFAFSKKKNPRTSGLFRPEENYVFWHNQDEIELIGQELVDSHLKKLAEGIESKDDDPRMFVPLTEEEERALPDDLKDSFYVPFKDHMLGLMQEELLNKFLDQPQGPPETERPVKGKAATHGWPFVKLAKFTSMTCREGKSALHPGFQFLFTNTKSFCKAIDCYPIEFHHFLTSNFGTIVFGSDQQFREYKPTYNKGSVIEVCFFDTILAYLKTTGLKTYPPISLLEKLERRDKVHDALCPIDDDFVDHSIQFSKCTIDYKLESTEENPPKRRKSSGWKNVWEDKANLLYEEFGKPYFEDTCGDNEEIVEKKLKLVWPAKWLDPNSTELFGFLLLPSRKHPKVGAICLEEMSTTDASGEVPEITRKYVAHAYRRGVLGKMYEDPSKVPAFGYGKQPLGFRLIPFIPEIERSKVVIVGEQDQRGRIILIMGFQRQIDEQQDYDPKVPWKALEKKEMQKFQNVCTKAIGSIASYDPDFDWGIYNNTLLRFDCFRGKPTTPRESEELPTNDGKDYFCTDVMPFNTNSDIFHLGFASGKNADNWMPNSVDDYSPVDLVASAFTKFFMYNYGRWP